MQVRVVEAGRQEAALQVNRLLADVARSDRFVRPGGDDALAINRDGLRHRVVLVRDKDLAVEKYEADALAADARALRRRVRSAEGGQERERQGECSAKSVHVYRVSPA